MPAGMSDSVRRDGPRQLTINDSDAGGLNWRENIRSPRISLDTHFRGVEDIYRPRLTLYYT